MKRKRKPVVIFIHIEKCAGTSINNILGRNMLFFTVPKVMIWTNDEKNNFTPTHMKKALKIFPFIHGFGGHSVRPYYDYQSITNFPVKYFTILRDPIKRYMSQYNYNRIELGRNLTIDEFIKEQRFNNFQTVKIAGEENLSKAIDILKTKMTFVGLVEEFNDLLQMIGQIIPKQKPVIANVIRNKTPRLKNKIETVKYKDLTESQKQKIIENNAVDIKLYNFVKEELYPLYKENYLKDSSAFCVQSDFSILDEVIIAFNKIYKRFFKIIIDKLVLNRY